MDSIGSSAQAIAEALAPQARMPSARWRWGTVASVSESGTMSVSIGGATVPGLRCAAHVMGARAGDRVRVMFCGTEALVDAVRAASGLLGLPDVEARIITAQEVHSDVKGGTFAPASGVFTPSFSTVRRRGDTVNFTVQGQLDGGKAAWSGFSGIGTLSAKPVDWMNFVGLVQVDGTATPVLCQLNPGTGAVEIRTLDAGIPAGSWMWLGGGYTAAD